jgi:hypothetical protein
MDSKRKGLFFVLVSGLLFLCLACLEIPEMSTLTDDVSNDFTILTHGSSSTEVIVCANQTQTVSRQSVAHRRAEFSFSAIEISTIPPESRDLLALHSIRRT